MSGIPDIQPSEPVTEVSDDVKKIVKGMQDGSLAKKYKIGSTNLTNGAMYGGLVGFVLGAFTGKKLELTAIGILAGAFLGYVNSKNQIKKQTTQ